MFLAWATVKMELPVTDRSKFGYKEMRKSILDILNLKGQLDIQEEMVSEHQVNKSGIQVEVWALVINLGAIVDRWNLWPRY